ncbi:hypothetical protein BHM03_00041196 [Ensete ventricosum]|nr:hypothetical protein BHM03_00041196 [Ensete ventricosum]
MQMRWRPSTRTSAGTGEPGAEGEISNREAYRRKVVDVEVEYPQRDGGAEANCSLQL